MLLCVYLVSTFTFTISQDRKHAVVVLAWRLRVCCPVACGGSVSLFSKINSRSRHILFEVRSIEPLDQTKRSKDERQGTSEASAWPGRKNETDRWK